LGHLAPPAYWIVLSNNKEEWADKLDKFHVKLDEWNTLISDKIDKHTYISSYNTGMFGIRVSSVALLLSVMIYMVDKAPKLAGFFAVTLLVSFLLLKLKQHRNS